ncbi:MAG: LytTR family transcriptional regulator [Prevotellaceae bacterium]|nr:LytTR family transcriptional regulator [Prevotellaceae bacterium]
MKHTAFTVRNETEIKAIHFDSLLAVTVDNYLCTFYLEGNDEFICTKKLKDIERILPEYFIKIRRNTIINAKKVNSLQTKECKISLFGNHTFKCVAKNVRTVKQFIDFNL